MDTFADARERDILNLAEVTSSPSCTSYAQNYSAEDSREPSAAGAGAGRGCRQVASLNTSPVPSPGLETTRTLKRQSTEDRQSHFSLPRLRAHVLPRKFLQKIFDRIDEDPCFQACPASRVWEGAFV